MDPVQPTREGFQPHSSSKPPEIIRSNTTSGHKPFESTAVSEYAATALDLPATTQSQLLRSGTNQRRFYVASGPFDEEMVRWNEIYQDVRQFTQDFVPHATEWWWTYGFPVVGLRLDGGDVPVHRASYWLCMTCHRDQVSDDDTPHIFHIQLRLNTAIQSHLAVAHGIIAPPFDNGKKRKISSGSEPEGTYSGEPGLTDKRPRILQPGANSGQHDNNLDMGFEDNAASQGQQHYHEFKVGTSIIDPYILDTQQKFYSKQLGTPSNIPYSRALQKEFGLQQGFDQEQFELVLSHFIEISGIRGYYIDCEQFRRVVAVLNPQARVPLQHELEARLGRSLS